jgi:hypothetical protein
MDNLLRTDLLAKPEMKEAIAKVRRIVRDSLPSGCFAEREHAVLTMLDEAGRSALEEELQSMADELGEEVLVNDTGYKMHEPGVVDYHSLSGALRVRRGSYRPVGVRNGPTVIALELAAGLIEGATPALAYNVAHGYAQHDMRLHGEALTAAHRTPPPRATLERLAKRVARAAHEAAPRLECIVRRAERLPEGAHAVVLGLDRTSVPMAEERPADAPPKPEHRRGKPRTRRAPKPIDVNFRMAYVGTVSIVDERGEALCTRRYASAACDDPAPLVERMSLDIEALLHCQPKLNVGVVQDGAPEMWSLMRAGLDGLKSKGALNHWEEGIDRYHLLERLGKALDILDFPANDRARLLTEWNGNLDTRDSAIDSIEHFVRSHYSALPVPKQESLWEHLVYLRNNKDRMRYVTLSVNGLPVGSGVTESAAKTVIGRRAKNSGQRWSQPGLRGVLTLRALHKSDRLLGVWSHLSRQYQAVVKAA